MRIFVFLLVLANLAFLAWSQGLLGSRESADAVRVAQQVAPEKLVVLARDEAPAAATKSEKVEKPAERKPVEKCLAWGGLPAADADRLEAFLAARYPELKRARRQVSLPASWWVYIPPQPNKAEADKKAAELKRIGVPEFFVVQDAGPNRFAISLGIFSSEEAAQDRLDLLRGKGVKTARTGKRESGRPDQFVIDATGLEAQVDAARSATGELLPDARTAACGNG